MWQEKFMVKTAIWFMVLTIASLFTAATICTADGGLLQVTVQKDSQNPLEGVRVYLFNESGAYLGQNQMTDAAGLVGFSVSEGIYKLRADYRGYQFWSADTLVTSDIDIDLTIAHQDVTITVEGVNQGSNPLAGLPVYLFTASDTYMNHSLVTDANGQVSFSLPGQPYKVRVDYLGQQFWSGEFSGQDTIVSIPMADGEITVTGDGLALAGVSVFVFSETGAYLGLTADTDSNGIVRFALPAGNYNFRADYQGSQYWSQVQMLLAGQNNPVALSTGGGTFSLTVSKGPGEPLAGIQCFVFNEDSSYLGISGSSDANGNVNFELADGIYKFRVDYQGYQCWTGLYDVPSDLSGDYVIAHQDVLITVAGVYQGPPDPIAGLPVYLFTASDTYMNQSLVTDANGQVSFSLPGQPYKVRVDYLGQQFWSGEITGQNTTVTIQQGMAAIHVHRIGTDVPGANVYLFSQSNAYLSWYETTDASGMTQFLLPARSFNFRADRGGDQRWSDMVSIIADQVTSVDINLADYPPTVTLVADPEIIPTNGSTTLTWSSSDSDTVAIDQGIGNVEPSGSITLSPTETTTYTISATGPGGTATADVTVTVNSPPSVTVVQPDGVDDSADAGFTIQWIDDDPDDDATVALYYDVDNSGADGTLIAAGLSEDADAVGDDEYIWDTSGIADGTFYVYAVIDDGVNDPVVDYSEGMVAIEHGPPSVAEIKLTAGDAGEYDYFGYSVSVAGDFAVVGAYGDEDYAGSAYIFKHEGQLWIQQTKLTASDAEEDDELGVSVSISGDYAIVGAVGDDYYTGSAYIFKYNGTEWTQQAKLTAGDGEEDDEFGISVSINGDYAVVGAWGDDDFAGSAYIFKREGEVWTQQAKLTDSDAEGFGYSVSISGDYSIVGAFGEESPTGSANIYKREGRVWTHQTKLAASDAEDFDEFGISVSISGDYAVVGASGNSDGGPYSGAAYVFKRDGSAWTEQAKLTASDKAEFDWFGQSVAMSGDLAVVSAPSYSSREWGTPSGSAYIFKREGSIWTEQTRLTAIDAGEWNGFGISVSISGEHAIVGADEDKDGGDYSGSAYIYSVGDILGLPSIRILQPDGVYDTRDSSYTIQWTDYDFHENAVISLYYDSDGSGADGMLIVSGLSEDPDLEGNNEYIWDTLAVADGTYYIYAVIDDGVNEPVVDYSDGAVTIAHAPRRNEIKLTAGDAVEGGNFGSSVSISGDYAIVGSHAYEGSAYVFTREGPGWFQQAKLLASDATPSDNFGSCVSISGDYAIVGAYGDDDSGSSSGSAYIFKRDGAEWSEQAKLIAGDAEAYDNFGQSVSISGDYAIVGASQDDDYGTSSGSAYVFRREGSGWTQQTKLTAIGARSYDRFGGSVSISGDYAIVGAKSEDDYGTYSGSAYIFKRGDSGWTQQAKLNASDADAWDTFGVSVSISGEYAIVGAYGDSDTAPFSDYKGAAYVFKREGSVWTEQAKLTAGDAVEGDYFGSSVSISGDYAIVGADHKSDYGRGSGSAYVFQREGSVWTELAKITAVDASEWDHFGSSVSISGDYPIVGAAGNDDSGSSSGSAYIYNLGDTSGAASIRVTEPSGDSGTVDSSFTIKWRDADYDSNAGIALYYDSDSSGADGTLIVSGLSEDPDDGGGDDYLWDTAVVAEGTYYVYAVIDDGEHDPVVDYSDGTVTINHTEIKLLAGDLAMGDKYGHSVDIAGEYAIVGAYGSDDGGDDSGAAYIFKSEGGWSQLVKLAADDRSGDDNFGRSVAIDGDYAIVGAPYADAGHGAAYIFKHDGTSWNQQVKLSASDAGLYDIFGNSVAIDGDYAVVGAVADDDYTGAAYIFKRVDSNWIEQAILTADDRYEGDYFGCSVAIDQDYVVVGAYGDYYRSFDSGAAYIFKREGENWSQMTKLTAADDAWGYHFGYSVDIDDPYLIVGATGQNYELLSPGAAYIFKRMGEFWADQTILTAPISQNLDYFGYSVSIDGDQAMVGASGDPYFLGGITGRAYVFSRSGEFWSLHSELDSGETAQNDTFGASVAIGGGRGLVGAPGPMYGEIYPGAAYLFLFSRVNISASDEQIRSGEITTLSWSFVDATYVTIDNGIGQVSENGSISLAPTQTTTYTITATGPWGTFTDSVTVTVLLEPAAYINADPVSLNLGGSSTLTWNCSTNAETCVIEPGIGSVELSGSIAVSPTATTTYTITAANQWGTANSSIVVEVIWPPPSVNFSADPATIYAGESTTLTWQTQYADAVTIEPDLGSQDLNGAAEATPAATTTYTLTAAGPGGTRTETVTVTVNRLPGIYYEYDAMGRIIKITRVPNK
ncbi:Unclassified head protein [Olavius sp. associated proteobacterium Delta 1]|nr:Unclassified head protein [Olavius sp. associated proteobacterium Delta 1]